MDNIYSVVFGFGSYISGEVWSVGFVENVNRSVKVVCYMLGEVEGVMDLGKNGGGGIVFFRYLKGFYMKFGRFCVI